MKKIFSLIMTLTLVIGISATQAFAKDTSSKVNQDVTKAKHVSLEKFAKEYWAPYGMNEKTQQKLIKEIKSGKQIDSMRPEMLSQAKVKKFTKVNTKGDVEKVTEYVYPDGSINVDTITLPKDTVNSSNTSNTGISPNAITLGSQTSGSGYHAFKGAEIHRTAGVVSASFYADFELIQGAYDLIQSVYNDNITIAGSYIIQSFGIVKANEDASGDALAELVFEGTSTGSYISTTFRMQFFVGNDTYYDTENW